MFRASWILYTTHLRHTALSKRALVCLLLALGPVAAALLIAYLSEDMGAPPVLIILWALQIQLVVPIVSLIMGSAVVAEEVEDRTVTYLFTRPIPRAALLFGRWCAAMTVLLVILLVTSYFVITILAGAAEGNERWALSLATQRRLLEAIALGAGAYTAVFAAAGALLRHPVIVGLGYTFAVEGFLGNLPGKNQLITIQFYLRSFVGGDDASVTGHLVEQLALQTLLAPSDAATRLGMLLVAALAFGAVVVSRKQYVLPS